jgi:hypothetical protein
VSLDWYRNYKSRCKKKLCEGGQQAAEGGSRLLEKSVVCLPP